MLESGCCNYNGQHGTWISLLVEGPEFTNALSSFILSMECQMLNKSKQTRLGPVIQRKAPENKSILSFQHSLFVPHHPSISNYHPSQNCKKYQREAEIGGLYWVNIWFSIEEIHLCTLDVHWRGMSFDVTNQNRTHHTLWQVTHLLGI